MSKRFVTLRTPDATIDISSSNALEHYKNRTNYNWNHIFMNNEGDRFFNLVNDNLTDSDSDGRYLRLEIYSYTNGVYSLIQTIYNDTSNNYL